jgi:4'-phosphopantetheinyl transferase
MRQILAHYLACSPASLEIDRQAGGKPYLAGNDQALEFNLSHTKGMALLAVCAHRPVGVDIEVVRAVADPLRLARRVMDQASIDALQATADTEHRLQLFLDLWTQLEARQKTHGLGIFAPAVCRESTQSFGFRVDDDWQGCVAVAASPEPVELRFFRFAVS